MSKTPRTDAARPPFIEMQDFVFCDFARDLERELAAANERIRRLEETLDLCDSAFSRFSPLHQSRYGDCWEAVRAALGRQNPHPEETKP